MARKMISMDGNSAAAHVSYAFTEVAAIYPITPSSVMAELTDSWSATGLKNIMGDTVKVVEMQSEAGAAGAVHGSLAAGALTTTFTASQGLLLMIPNMYKIAGELLPSVIHVSARCVASHALNIFGDHSDVYACRQTGYAMMACTNPQEVMDLGAVCHLATIKGRVPFLNFFDGFRTSHEIQKIEVWDYDDLAEMVDKDAIAAFRARALNPEHPVLRGSAENGDIFFQHREACNPYYDALPSIVEEYMDKVNAKIGTDYKPFNYYGAPDADRVIIAMGSICDVIEEVIDYMNANGEKVGLVKVRLYRPFCADKLVNAIPTTAKKIAVLDRTKEPGSLGEPLYLDVVASLASKGINAKVVGGRYGLGSKDTPPQSVFAVYENLKQDEPKANFTIGIVDDVTGLSLPEVPAPDTAAAGTVSCKFWGLGGDGTVGANKNSIKIIGDYTDKFIQAYFQYDSKKTGGITISHLRFGDSKIKSPYYITKANFVACHNPSYMQKGYKIVQDVKPGGTFLLNCQWNAEELEANLPADAKKYIAENNISFYIVNAIDKAREIGMGKRTNTILQSAFFALANIMPIDTAIEKMKYMAKKSYSKKGDAVVEMNYKAIDAGVDALVKVEVPASWKNAVCDACEAEVTGDRPELVKFVKTVLNPVSKQLGDTLPVSAFKDMADGTYPQGSSAYEKRGVAVEVPVWNADTCAKCNKCAYVCPHATIRPFALTADEVAAAPAQMKKAPKPIVKTEYVYTLAISPMDCMGCGVCIGVCPTNSLTMVAKDTQLAEQEVFDYCVANVTEKEDVASNKNVISSQYKQPLLEFSGSCAGCAETSYARLITQLFGERMYISNATGCSSIWGGSAPATPYTVNKASGRGPAWGNSLFEDNAEHGLGIYLGQKTIRNRLIEKVKALETPCEKCKAIVDEYLNTIDDGAANEKATKALVELLEGWAAEGCEASKEILAEKNYLSKKSVWIFGGDGWAYDIGFGGLDHVIASGEDVNIMVFDTEVYSNTGGQASKASNIGQVAQFAAAGKAIGKKDLAQIAMSYGYVYVAQVAMGNDMNQTLKALTEAEAYHGPSIVIAYAPCEMHGLKGGMTNCQTEMKKAVEAGYWQTFRYNPALKAEGKNPLTIDCKEPTASYVDFIKSENRYSRLANAFPERAAELFEKAEKNAKAKFEHLKKLEELYGK
ncbi:MAG: pyruvate:ferredoxin (flavodoxin) oxidoreductase [Clostridia bacterium]|nr:pyruvate:ferredoxin (flavodoxin) oxidoreductase [Clostridia bacterium]MBP3370542.1 pyruvate:ferredoxin (flavodoxin) oxidoreductase [Clostridia bacterium]